MPRAPTKPKSTLATVASKPSVEQQAALPPREWLRVKEACDYSRVSKPKLYDLINRGLIKSVALRERGQIKGTRLISFDSLKGFLDSRATGGQVATASQA